MKISLNTIRSMNRRYECAGDIAPDGPQALITRIGAQLGEVESVQHVGAKYHGVLVVKVISCDDHPNADRLHICKIDDGGKASGAERDQQGHVQVVCGAPNVRAGLRVAWLPPGSTVPSTADHEPFVLEARELRGVMSYGMLASPKELALGDSHEGIFEIHQDIAPGTPFAEAFELADDVIIDIENKMFTHRPDCFGFLGVSRELAGIQGLPFKSPAWYRLQPEVPTMEAEELKLTVRNELPELVPRFTAMVLCDVKVGPSPAWLHVELAKLGQRSINNIVDYSNFFMLQTGQPLHAYDYDKVLAQDRGVDQATIVVRHPRPGEKIRLLNGKEIEPRAEAIMIATEQKLIGVGGVMGGVDTEVDEQTTKIIIECANFDMYSIRRTSMVHGLFTDAVSRFNKGQSPLQNLAVLMKITDEIRRQAGGKVAGSLIDDNHLLATVMERGSLYPAVSVDRAFINERLGLELSAADMQRLLTNVECDVTLQEEQLAVVAPFWRTDIEQREDVVEEVGRLYGYDGLPLKLPRRAIMPVSKDPLLELKAALRTNLAGAGANEVLTYSFVHGNLLERVGQNPAKAFRLSNALSPDLQYYRTSLLPSLLDKVHANIKAGYNEFALFELGKAHTQSESDHWETEVPKEVNALGLIYASRQSRTSAPYYQAAYYLRRLLQTFRVSDAVAWEPLATADLYANPWLEQMVAPFAPQRSAVLRDDRGFVWGVVGEFRNAVSRALKLPTDCAGFEIDPLLFLQKGSSNGYTILPRFPKLEQDICFRLPSAVSYEQLHELVRQAADEVFSAGELFSLDTLDIYQSADKATHKQITFRLSVASYQKTLTDAEVSSALDSIAHVAASRLQAERV